MGDYAGNILGIVCKICGICRICMVSLTDIDWDLTMNRQNLAR